MRSLRVLIVLSSVASPAVALAQTAAQTIPSTGAAAPSPAPTTAPTTEATPARATAPTTAPTTAPSAVAPAPAESAPSTGTTATPSGPTAAAPVDLPAETAPAPTPEPENGPGTDPSLPAPAQATGAPNPSALSPSSSDEWRFSTHGYFRAPLRVGLAKRPVCGNGQRAGDTVDGVACAGDGQSQLNFHSPFLADDQYLDWRYTRQWERDWTEVFLNFGNSTIVGTVGLQAWNITDASYNNTDAQLGISQAYVTIKPKLGGRKRFEAKVGSFWNRYGGAGKYDAGKYDTYLYGRTHVMGEVLNGELDVGSFTLRASHGFGAKSEQKTIGDTSPGFTLLNHVHAGVSYKKLVDLNAHYLVTWAQDGRATPQIPDGQIHVAGVETRVTGGVYGELFAGYSHISAVHAQAVGPGLEVMHSMGGGGVNAANGLVENYLGPCAACKPVDRGSGQINTVSLQYDYSFGTLWRRLRNPKEGFWGDGADVTMSLFGMYTNVASRDEKADGTEKLKFGTDVVYTAMSWLGVGLRADRVMPNSKDTEESFSVVSPKVIFRTRFVTHEEITAQYSKYWYGSKVRPQYPNQAALPDQNVFGLKATMWW